MSVTEQELNDLRVALRGEFTQGLNALKQELAVRLQEGLAAVAPGLSAEDVRHVVDAAIPPAEVTAADLARLDQRISETALVQPAQYDDTALRAELLRLRLHVAGLADRVGAPRMEG